MLYTQAQSIRSYNHDSYKTWKHINCICIEITSTPNKI